MPSEGAPADLDDSRQSFPKVEAEIGEDPARFLDAGIFTPDGESSGLSTALARIRGIDRLEVIGAWQGVEKALGTPDRGGDYREECPRRRVMLALEERREELLATGEREDQLERRLDPPEDVEKGTAYAIRDGERIPLEEAQRSAAGKIDSPGFGRAAATDGGADS